MPETRRRQNQAPVAKKSNPRRGTNEAQPKKRASALPDNPIHWINSLLTRIISRGTKQGAATTAASGGADATGDGRTNKRRKNSKRRRQKLTVIGGSRDRQMKPSGEGEGEIAGAATIEKEEDDGDDSAAGDVRTPRRSVIEVVARKKSKRRKRKRRPKKSNDDKKTEVKQQEKLGEIQEMAKRNTTTKSKTDDDEDDNGEGQRMVLISENENEDKTQSGMISQPETVTQINRQEESLKSQISSPQRRTDNKDPRAGEGRSQDIDERISELLDRISKSKATFDSNTSRSKR